MKDIIVSNSEKAFLTELISKNQRLDGRDPNQFRPININFSSEWGCVHVALGETRVLAKVTCDVVQPKATRPNEGLLFLKVEIGPMAAPNFEPNRTSDLAVQVNRILERAFKDSRCIDLESLCITAEEKVWNLRVDINVLNHEGNIIDCASIAALAAIAHFKRPDVTISGDEFTIHTYAEKDPIPIALHHYPVCVSYAIFKGGEIALVDPSASEENVAEANLVFGLNSYRELCGLHYGGQTLTSSQLFLRCASRGAKHAKHFVDIIKNALKKDEEARTNGESVGFTECVRLNRITSLAQNRLSMKLKRFKLANDSESDESGSEDNNKMDQESILSIDDKSAVLLPEMPKWIPESDFEDDDEEMDMGHREAIKTERKPITNTKNSGKQKKKKKAKKQAIIMDGDNSGDSEEGETVVLESSEHIC